MSFQEWVTTALAEDLASGLRFGQSYMNRVRPDEICPELFYETDEEKAWKLIWERETR